MKMFNLNMLVKASVKSRKLPSILYGLFILTATALILAAVGIVVPLHANIDRKINNHIINREIYASFASNTPQEKIDEALNTIKSTDGVTDIYKQPASLGVSDNGGEFSQGFELNYVHVDYTPVITAGEMFSESDTNVALIPQIFKTIDDETSKIIELDGADFIGKTVKFTTTGDVEYAAKIVGTYNTADPMYDGKQILIPRADLLNLDEAEQTAGSGILSEDVIYTAVTESGSVRRSVLDALEGVATVYTQPLGIDADTYNMAFYVIFVSCLFFIVLSIFGLYLTLKTDVSARSSELALYRAIGYKSRHIYYALFCEYFVLGAASIALGTAASLALNSVVINPMLYDLCGGTAMEMTVTFQPLTLIIHVAAFLITLASVCLFAAKRSAKIDLTVLLREN